MAIIVAERGPTGVRLVAVDDRGDRQFALITASETRSRDTHPAVSPDGRWIVFASSRARPTGTSLWIAPLGVEQPARALTATNDTRVIDTNPVWMPDGSAIVFASTREGDDFDLWRLPMRDGRAAGDAEQLTHGAAHEVAPTVARDGTIIYASVTPRAEALTDPGKVVRASTSQLEQRAPDGVITRLTEGPDDGSPALSPDETQLAFTCGRGFETLTNRELCIVRREALASSGVAARVVVDLPPTDEDNPTWSRDGRVLVATSLLRGERTMLFSSVIAIDLAARPIKARILVDRAGAVARLTPTVIARTIASRDLAANPEYLPELARIMMRAIDEKKRAAEVQPPTAP